MDHHQIHRALTDSLVMAGISAIAAACAIASTVTGVPRGWNPALVVTVIMVIPLALSLCLIKTLSTLRRTFAVDEGDLDEAVNAAADTAHVEVDAEDEDVKDTADPEPDDESGQEPPQARRAR